MQLQKPLLHPLITWLQCHHGYTFNMPTFRTIWSQF